jgi:hypothetical protein
MLVTTPGLIPRLRDPLSEVTRKERLYLLGVSMVGITIWTCIGSVDCLRLRTVRGKESIATNKPGLPTRISPRSYPAG